MDHLPWLVVHGLAAFAAALGLASLAGAVWGWLRPRRRARREAAAARARLGAPHTDAAAFADLGGSAPVTVAGVLRVEGDGAPVAARSADAPDTPPARAERLALVDPASGAPLVTLLGPVEVLAGAREVRPETPAWVWRSVEDGDRVRVQGALRREAAAAPQAESYRAAHAGVWTLSPPEGATALLLAVEGAPRVVGPERRRVVGAALRAGATFVVLGTLAGEAALLGVTSPPGAHVGERPFPTWPARLAAATPVVRAKALELIDADLHTLPAGGASWLDTAVELAELRGECDRGAQELIDHGALARAVAMARRCGSPRMEARAEYLRGGFVEASQMLHGAGEGHGVEDAVFDARVHLLAGDRDGAVVAARRLNDIHSLDPVVRCLAASLEGFPPVEHDAPECLLLLADRERGAARSALLGPMPRYADSPSYVRDLLDLEACLGADGGGAPRPEACPALPDAYVRQASSLAEHPSGLFGAVDGEPPAFGLAIRVRDALAAAPRPRPASGWMEVLAADTAVFAALSGDHLEARRWATATESREAPGMLAAAVSLYAGDAGPARALPDRVRDATILHWLADLHDGKEVPLGTGYDQGLAGKHDGAVVAAWLRKLRAEAGRAYPGPPRAEPPVLPGILALVAPQVTSHREAVVDEIRAAAVSCWWCSPEHVAFALARRRDAAAAFGDAALASETDAILAAFRQVLRRRDLAVPLFVVSQVRFGPPG